MKLNFEKYSAHGNDFIVLDNRNKTLSAAHRELFRKLCQRRLSVGADGVILIDTERPDFVVQFFNTDGTPAFMCGNGARVTVHYVRDLGIISHEARFWVQKKMHKAKIEQNSSIGVEIYHQSQNCTNLQTSYKGKEYEGFLCDTGVPHFVFINTDVNDEESLDFAKTVRYAPDFSPDGVNVNFMHVSDEHTISIRTYERGVEGFTFSCGTGAVAGVRIGILKAGLKLPVTVHSKGGKLLVTEGDSPGRLWIWGTVEKVYAGVIENV